MTATALRVSLHLVNLERALKNIDMVDDTHREMVVHKLTVKIGALRELLAELEVLN